MDKVLAQLDKDIKRCEDVLNQKNHLELVIAIEELVDKYKSSIKEIFINNDKVWNYNKKDLEIIKDKLNLYKKDLINKENQEKILYITNEMRVDVIKSKNLPDSSKEEIIFIINELERISNKDIKIDEKWMKLKKYIIYSSEQDINIGIKLIYIINLILKD